MASTITGSTMTVTIKEQVSLNNWTQGASNVLSITGIGEVAKRIVSCPSGSTTTVTNFGATVATAASDLDVGNCKYYRLTNKDDTVNIEVAVVGDTDTSYTQKLGPGESLVLGATEALMKGVASTTPDFGTMEDIGRIQVKPVDPSAGEDTDIEFFAASA